MAGSTGKLGASVAPMIPATISSTDETIGAEPATGGFARFADRWIYVFMAGLFICTVLLGFIPDSMAKLAAVRAHQRPPFPPIMHVHALLMGSWLSLLLIQALLMATGRRALHRKLGLLATVLVPLMLVAMVLIVKMGFERVAAAAAAPGVDSAAISNLRLLLSTLLPEQIRSALLFGVFTGWALWVRNRDSEMHKRLMVLATLMPLPAGIDRIRWLPSTLPASADSLCLYTLLWLTPVLIYDLVRRGRIHRAYLIGVGLNLPLMVAAHFIVRSPRWLAAAPRLLGMHW